VRDEDIRRFIDGLRDVSGFEDPVTGVDGWEPDDQVPPDFDEWFVRAHTRLLHRYFSEPDVPPFGAALIEDRVRGRLYEQTPCEPGSWFLSRLRREARLAAEPWLLVLLPKVPGVEQRMWEEWASAYAPRPFLLSWYLEARGRGRACQRQGNVVLGETIARLTE
jgi:hypothetical protein